jgi:plasmid stabilization system protein ParE
LTRIQFRPEARAEALEAKTWYEKRAPGLGLEFARALDAAVQLALRKPWAFSFVEGECRRIVMRRFPYSVIYRPEPQGILVVAIFHHRREPSKWGGRADG